MLEALADEGLTLGGEQSGHVIFADLATTGDGLLTAVQLLDVVAAPAEPLGELADAAMTRLPQVLHNVRVAGTGVDLAAPLAEEIAAVEAELGDHGRVLVRGSGTEPLVRVMVEAPTADAGRSGGGSPGGGHRGPRGRLRPPVGFRWVCGIIALLRGPGARAVLDPAEVLEPLTRGPAGAATAPTLSPPPTRRPRCSRSSTRCSAATDGVALLVRDRDVATRAAAVGAAVHDWIDATEAQLDADGAPPERDRSRRPTPRCSA